MCCDMKFCSRVVTRWEGVKGPCIPVSLRRQRVSDWEEEEHLCQQSLRTRGYICSQEITSIFSLIVTFFPKIQTVTQAMWSIIDSPQLYLCNGFMTKIEFISQEKNLTLQCWIFSKLYSYNFAAPSVPHDKSKFSITCRGPCHEQSFLCYLVTVQLVSPFASWAFGSWTLEGEWGNIRIWTQISLSLYWFPMSNLSSPAFINWGKERLYKFCSLNSFTWFYSLLSWGSSLNSVSVLKRGHRMCCIWLLLTYRRGRNDISLE